MLCFCKVLFTNGSIIDFGYCDGEADMYRYQSAEFDVIRFDELTRAAVIGADAIDTPSQRKGEILGHFLWQLTLRAARKARKKKYCCK